jgi:uncharacterized protein YndB with AHSA1/START domain
MTSITFIRVIPASPERVWQLIGGFTTVSGWLPLPEATSLEGGRVRQFPPPEGSDGTMILERLLEFSEAEMRCTYSVYQGPFPFTDHVRELRVFRIEGDPGSAEVQWTSRFTPQGVSEEEASAIFTHMYPLGLESLAKALA